MTHPRSLAPILILLLGGCSVQIPTSDGQGHFVPPRDDGKADNYVSTNAREFDLLGEAHLTLPEGLDELEPAERDVRIQRAVDQRLSRVRSAIQTHIQNVLRPLNGGATGEDVDWFTYMRRNTGTAERVELLGDGQARFEFRINLVGSVYLMSQLSPGESARRTFEVEVTDFSSNEPERVTVRIQGSESRDAFPRYDELFADGIYDIAVHFGGDYNEGRHDLETARWLVEALVEGGWANNNVQTFDDLRIDSPPFTRTLRIEGQEVEARVYIFHADMVEAAEEQRLTDAMVESLGTADVVIYSGHAGEGAGFILDYEPRHEIRASALAELPMAQKYQIYVLDGCRTYRSYVDDILANPNKTFENLDIVTTVNTTPFAAGYQTIHEFIHWLTITDNEGRHFPVSWMTLLRGLNTSRYDSVHYGVHGIDENPQLNPHASEGVACMPCQSDSECGGGGNFCLNYGFGGSGCGVACTTDTACGPGFRCARIFDREEHFYIPKQCVPVDYTCSP